MAAVSTAEAYRNHSAAPPSSSTNAAWAVASSSVSRSSRGTGRARRTAAETPPPSACDRTGEDQRGLAAAGQLGIDLGEDLGVEQGAVLGAPRIVDAVAPAERVEADRRAGMTAPRQGQRIDHPLQIERWSPQRDELRRDEAEVELGVVGDELGALEEGGQLVDDLGEQRLAGEERRGEAVDAEGLLRHVALRVEIMVEGLAGGGCHASARRSRSPPRG